MQVIKNIRLKFGNIILCFIISILCFSNVSALTAEETVDFNFTFNPSLSISLSSDELVIENLMPGNYANSNTISINVQTNNRNGYTLTAEVGDSETAALANNSLVNTIASTSFTSLANNASATLASFTPNYWGYTISKTVNDETLYSGLLYGATTTLNQTVDPSGRAVGNYYGGTVTNFTIGASAGVDQTSGEYTNIISFNIVPNVSTDVTIESLKYLQDIAKLNRDQRTSVLNSMTTGQSYQLVDSRDGEVYNVAKLADGNMWLQDNLRLGGDQPIALSQSNTNITGSWTLPASINEGFDSFDTAMINADYKNNEYGYGEGDGKAGAYYNYCAASAGTICTSTSDNDAQYDICPAGWRMPTGNTAGEYQALYAEYNNYTNFRNALHAILPGTFFNNAKKENDQGRYWSSTRHSDGIMYFLYMTSSEIDAGGSVAYRNNGYSVRCIADNTTIVDASTLQDFASLTPLQRKNVISSMYPELQYTVKDARDNQDYTITKLSDSTVWMTKNLNLAGGTTLTPATSNVASDYTLPASSTTGFSSDEAYVYNSNSATCGDNQPCYSYYSYVAAAAGTNPSAGDAVYDICPKGWRLPVYNEYSAFVSIYQSGNALASQPWNGVYAGVYYNSSFYGGGASGGYWSSTASDASDAYYLDFNNSNTYVTGYNKNRGRSVRCVLNTTLQDATNDILNMLVPHSGDTTTLSDKRDGEKYTVGRLADGNVWLLENLRLGGTSTIALTPSDTNVTASFTLPASTSGSTGSYTEGQINIENKNTTASYGSGNGKVGVIYNYCAASAGTICAETVYANARSSVCPKGWHMPDGNTTGQFAMLYEAYDSNLASFENAIRVPYDYAIWTNTMRYSDHRYVFRVGSNYIYTQNSQNRREEYSVRCIKSN